MLCQHCQSNPAIYHFRIGAGPWGGEFHLCQECATAMAEGYKKYMGSGAVSAPAAWEPPTHTPGQPVRVSEDFRLQRELAALQNKLQAAVHAEDYESAAELRDEINRAKQRIQTAQEAKQKEKCI